jgi:hypothetical protein
MIKREKTRKCKFCGEEFELKHRNRQFCPDKKCHDYFNNDKKLPMLKQYWHILKGLHKNEQILNHFFDQKRIEVKHNELKAVGYDFLLLISLLPNDEKSNIWANLNYGVIRIDDNNYKIIKHGKRL